MGGLKRGRWPSREPGGARWARSVPRRSQARRTMMSPPLLRARTLTVRSDCSGVPGACRWLRTRPVGVCVQPDGDARGCRPPRPDGRSPRVHVRRSRHRRPTQHPRHQRADHSPLLVRQLSATTHERKPCPTRPARLRRHALAAGSGDAAGVAVRVAGQGIQGLAGLQDKRGEADRDRLAPGRPVTGGRPAHFSG